MDNSEKLFAIKLVHTLIWLFFVSIIFYILYSGITDRVSTLTWIAIGLVIVEGIVLLLCNMFCPLTIVARRYSNSKKDNFDIFLPNWLARHNKLIFTSIYLIGVLIVLIRVGFG
ncbi:hypothetical protein [Maribacter arenosus]|uniref:Uncharacterized protein n=1 Tax=Maribacter arenosus TaxID=1854708 RepID=A0ABR7VEI9_9FLAO|nr:hypothetical protein [Maribacter arenosus]MBD0852054.1 hypothetical protein [Maribacter arenosus]